MMATLGSCLSSDEVIRACHVLDCLGIPQVKITSHECIIRDKAERPSSSLVIVSSDDLQAANRFRRKFIKDVKKLSREARFLDKLVILGIEYLEHCFSCGKGIPNINDPGCRIHLTPTLYGWNVAYATGKNNGKEIEDISMMIYAMGGDFESEICEKAKVIVLSPTVLTSNNVDKGVLGTRLLNCVNADTDISLVNISWLQSCWKLRTLQKPWDHRFRLLDGHTICSTGQGPNGKQTLKRAAEICGATWSDHLDTTCTVLIATNAHGDKFEYAQRKGIPVVKEKWLWDCIRCFCVQQLSDEEYNPDSNQLDPTTSEVGFPHPEVADGQARAFSFDKNKKPVRSNIKGSRIFGLTGDSFSNETPTKNKLSVTWADNLECVHYPFSVDEICVRTTEDSITNDTIDVSSHEMDCSAQVLDKDNRPARSKSENNNTMQINQKHTLSFECKVLSRRRRGAFLAQICEQNEVEQESASGHEMDCSTLSFDGRNVSEGSPLLVHVSDAREISAASISSCPFDSNCNDFQHDAHLREDLLERLHDEFKESLQSRKAVRQSSRMESAFAIYREREYMTRSKDGARNVSSPIHEPKNEERTQSDVGKPKHNQTIEGQNVCKISFECESAMQSCEDETISISDIALDNQRGTKSPPNEATQFETPVCLQNLQTTQSLKKESLEENQHQTVGPTPTQSSDFTLKSNLPERTVRPGHAA
eukprot:191299-Hanusia_phi.AAC.1